MSRQHHLQQHLRQLAEISEIMNSMKNLAFMENRKLARHLDCQRRVTRNIEAIAVDFLAFYPAAFSPVKHAQSVHLLIGSERGFCGDFNEKLLHQAETRLKTDQVDSPLLIVVGHKLSTKLAEETSCVAFIDGPNVTDDIPAVLNQVTITVETLRKQYGIVNLSVVFYDSEADGIIEQKVLPPFQTLRGQSSPFTNPPLLNLAPPVFMADLVDHYLFAALHEIFFTSLMAENQKRIQHMEGAIRHLDDKIAALSRKGHLLRQEEITEELEVILLTAESRSRPKRQIKFRASDS